jgi:hypothetical protein
VRFFGNVLDRRDTATPSHEEGKAFRIKRIPREPLQLLRPPIRICIESAGLNVHLLADPFSSEDRL